MGRRCVPCNSCHGHSRLHLPAICRLAPETKPRRVAVRGVSMPQALSGDEASRLADLFQTWKAEHGLSFANVAEEQAALDAFTQHVSALEDAMRLGRPIDVPHLDKAGRPTRFNRFAGVPRSVSEATYRGKASVAALSAVDKAPASPSPLTPSSSRCVGLEDQRRCDAR